MLKHLLLVVALTLPTFTLVSCIRSTTNPAPPKTPLQNVSNSLLVVAETIGNLQTTLINANMQGLINDQVTGDILRVTVKIAQAGKEATKVTQSISQISPGDKTKLLGIFNPIVAAVKESLSTGLVNIKDPTTLSAIGVALTIVQAALTDAQVILGGQ